MIVIHVLTGSASGSHNPHDEGIRSSASVQKQSACLDQLVPLESASPLKHLVGARCAEFTREQSAKDLAAGNAAQSALASGTAKPAEPKAIVV